MNSQLVQLFSVVTFVWVFQTHIYFAVFVENNVNQATKHKMEQSKSWL